MSLKTVSNGKNTIHVPQQPPSNVEQEASQKDTSRHQPPLSVNQVDTSVDKPFPKPAAKPGEVEQTEKTENIKEKDTSVDKPFPKPAAKPGQVEQMEKTENIKEKDTGIGMDSSKVQRLVIIGSGPTSLGAAQRLFELGIMRSNTQLIILEQESFPGGLAISKRDKNGFLWDMGGHVVFSHYTYFDQSLDEAVPEWNMRTRAAFAFMKGADEVRRFIPYPVQESIDAMDKKMQDVCLKGLEEITLHPRKEKPVNFDDWLLKNFGEGLCDVFMRKYNRKVWTVNSTQMNAAWVGERVAVPDIEKIKAKIAAKGRIKDTSWGPNKFFRFPKYGGTGAIWKAIAARLPQGWFYYNQSVVGVSLKKKLLTIVPHNDSTHKYHLKYDMLITTAPLDTFVGFINEIDSTTQYMQSLATHFVYSHTHVIGVGLSGQPPKSLSDKSWIYFPDSDSPFYRVTVFSNYSNDHVPKPGRQWSLMCEAAEPKMAPNPEYWTEKNLIAETIQALINYGYIRADQVVSRYHRRLHHGYPVPFLIRENLLRQIQPWLQDHDVYSRGRFGGWRYEVSNQDHSFSQGVEIAEYLMTGAPEQTYPNPNKVNSQKNTGHPKLSLPTVPEYEFVVSYSNGSDLDFIRIHSNHSHVYHRGNEVIPRYEFRQWDRLPSIGGEAHAYLHHVISNYDHLADVTVFLNDNIGTYQKQGYVYDNIQAYVDGTKRNGISFKSPGRMLSNFASGRSTLSSLGSLEKFWETIFKKRSHPEKITFTPGNCFGVSRTLVRKHPREFYETVLAQLTRQNGKEFNDYMSKLWITIFTLESI